MLRNTDATDMRVRTGGLGFGAGGHLSLLRVGGYAEGRYVLVDGSDNQLIFRLGLRI